MGSGTIIDADGTILTCAHLVVGSHGVRGLSKGKVSIFLGLKILLFAILRQELELCASLFLRIVCI